MKAMKTKVLIIVILLLGSCISACSANSGCPTDEEEQFKTNLDLTWKNDNESKKVHLIQGLVVMYLIQKSNNNSAKKTLKAATSLNTTTKTYLSVAKNYLPTEGIKQQENLINKADKKYLENKKVKQELKTDLNNFLDELRTFETEGEREICLFNQFVQFLNNSIENLDYNNFIEKTPPSPPPHSLQEINKKIAQLDAQINNVDKKAKNSGFSLIHLLLFMIPIIALGYVVFFLLPRLLNQQKQEFEREFGQLNKSIASTQQSIQIARRKPTGTSTTRINNQHELVLNDFSQRLSDLEKITSKLRIQLDEEDERLNSQSNQRENSSHEYPENTKPKNGPQARPFTRKFAKSPWKDGAGSFFSAKGLQSKERSDYVYILEIYSENEAYFYIQTTPEAKELLTGDPTIYLDGACEYDGSVQQNKKIITETKGDLIKEGRKWRVNRKAKILFR